MNTFNKVVVVILLVLLFLLLLVTAAIPDWILRAIQDGALALSPLLSASGRLILAAIAIVLWLVVLGLLWLELRPTRSAEIRLPNAQGFESHVSAVSVARRLEQGLMTVPDVDRARVQLEESKQGVVATLLLETRPDVNVPSVSSAAVAQAEDVLENQVGAKVAKVNVHIRHSTAAVKKQEPVKAVQPAQQQPVAAWTPPPSAQPAVPAWGPAATAPAASAVAQEPAGPVTPTEAAEAQEGKSAEAPSEGAAEPQPPVA